MCHREHTSPYSNTQQDKNTQSAKMQWTAYWGKQLIKSEWCYQACQCGCSLGPKPYFESMLKESVRTIHASAFCGVSENLFWALNLGGGVLSQKFPYF